MKNIAQKTLAQIKKYSYLCSRIAKVGCIRHNPNKIWLLLSFARPLQKFFFQYVGGSLQNSRGKTRGESKNDCSCERKEERGIGKNESFKRTGMTFLTASDINKTSYYQVIQEDELSVTFCTASGIKYSVGITKDPFIFQDNSYYLYIVPDKQPPLSSQRTVSVGSLP